MTTFEEEFPSLSTHGPCVGCDLLHLNEFNQDCLKKYCLDKQRVREAIRAICDEPGDWDISNETFFDAVKRKFNEELGLE